MGAPKNPPAFKDGDEAGALVERIATDRSALLLALYDAKLQLQYLDSRWPTGTTPAIIGQCERVLNDALPWDVIGRAFGGGEAR